MGYLEIFNLKEYVDKHNLSMYFESGVGTGTGFRYAKKSNLKKFFGVEVVEERANALIEEFKNDKTVSIYAGKSVYFLETILKDNPNENFLFWLDGHYPGEVYSNMDISELLPLKKELELIFNHNGSHVIIIDDLRIYEDAPYEAGLLPDWAVGDKSGLNIPDKYEQTRLLRHEGYLILTPKEVKVLPVTENPVAIKEEPVKKNERIVKKSAAKK